VSDDAELRELPQPGATWDRLELASERARAALTIWRARALEAEAEVERLRRELEILAADPSTPTHRGDVVRRLRAENAALRSRLAQARRRVGTLLAWTDVLEESR
jgi:uncharacterized membrane protein